MLIILLLALAGLVGSGFLGFFLGTKLTLAGLIVVITIGVIVIWLIVRKGKTSFDVFGGPELTMVTYCILLMLFFMTLSGLKTHDQYFDPYIETLKKFLVK